MLELELEGASIQRGDGVCSAFSSVTIMTVIPSFPPAHGKASASCFCPSLLLVVGERERKINEKWKRCVASLYAVSDKKVVCARKEKQSVIGGIIRRAVVVFGVAEGRKEGNKLQGERTTCVSALRAVFLRLFGNWCTSGNYRQF